MDVLSHPQRLQVFSDSTLASGAGAATLANAPPIAPKSLRPVAELARWPGPVRPGELLHVLGEAFTPELPDSEFWTSAQWALYRYLWAFAPVSRALPLRLSDAAMRLVDHHRTLASEQLGIACALHVGLWVLAERHSGFAVDWVDADMALDANQSTGAGLGLTAVSKSRRMRPDYFLIAADPQTDTDYVYALECKGTHYPSTWKGQMKKGASQVGGVTVRGSPAPSLVVSTVLSDRAIEVRVLDPPGGDDWAGPPDFASEADAVGDVEPDRPLEITNMPLFRGDLHRITDARRLAFAGQFGSAAEILPERVRPVRLRGETAGDAELEEFGTSLGTVSATRALLPLGDRALEVRTGLARDELEALREATPEERRRRRATRWAAAERDRDIASMGRLRLDDDQRGIQSLRYDGTFLGLRLT
jgi:hypothetical protein